MSPKMRMILIIMIEGEGFGVKVERSSNSWEKVSGLVG